MSTRSELDGSLQAMHDKQIATRLNRLNKLIDLEYGGSVTQLVKNRAGQAGRAQLSYRSYISQLQMSNRPLGESAARRLEAACGKPYGWFDGLYDAELNMKEQASAHRAELLRKFIDEQYEGDAEKMLAEKKVGTRRKSMILNILKGTRFMSLSVAESIENECGMPSGYLTGA